MPAKKAPRANDTLNRLSPVGDADGGGITASVNNSREPVRATCHSNQGRRGGRRSASGR
jgi:hypothetical protein